MKGILYLEDGTKYIGRAFGKMGTAIGELVFNTSMTGYQEILSDPSYAGQIITMTYPLIGNYGTNSIEKESHTSLAKGFIAKSISLNPSNHLCEETISAELVNSNVIGLYDVDTRSITKKIRQLGSTKCLITTMDYTDDEMDNLLQAHTLRGDWMKIASTNTSIHHTGTGLRVAIIDYGIKSNIVRILQSYDCDIKIFPHNAKLEDIKEYSPNGVLLSNGPGDPKEATESIELVKQLTSLYPIFGICMGHQVLCLALGGDTFKMKFGHRGANHGVYDITKDRAYITSQNHGYAVSRSSLVNTDINITHLNLNDDTVEGVSHKTLPIFSVQFHPEGAPGPCDSKYLFDTFITNMGGTDICQ